MSCLPHDFSYIARSRIDFHRCHFVFTRFQSYSILNGLSADTLLQKKLSNLKRTNRRAKAKKRGRDKVREREREKNEQRMNDQMNEKTDQEEIKTAENPKRHGNIVALQHQCQSNVVLCVHVL